MIVWNAQEMNRLRSSVEARFAARIAKAATKIAGGRFTVKHGKAPGGHAVWSSDPESRVTEYGDGVQRPRPWANEAIRKGVSGGRNQ